MKTSRVFDIVSGAVSILNQNGHWHKKVNRDCAIRFLAIHVQLYDVLKQV